MTLFRINERTWINPKLIVSIVVERWGGPNDVDCYQYRIWMGPGSDSVVAVKEVGDKLMRLFESRESR